MSDTIQPSGSADDPSSGGQGDSIALRLDDPKHPRRTLRTLRRAVSSRWNIPSDVRAKLGAEMWELVQTAEEERVRVSAAAVLKGMMDSNQRDELAILDRIAPKPQAVPQVNVNVQQGISIRVED